PPPTRGIRGPGAETGNTPSRGTREGNRWTKRSEDTMGTPTVVKRAARVRPLRRTGRGLRWNMAAALVLVLALAALALPGGTGHAAAPSDVPADHWARGAVVDMIDRGVLGTQDGGLFRGEQPVTRYDLAVALARVLQEAG